MPSTAESESRHTPAGFAPRGSQAERQALLTLLRLSPSLTRILRYFVIRPTARPRLRALQRDLRLGSASIQRDLSRMTAAAVLYRFRDPAARTIRFAVVPHPFWEVARALVAASHEPADLLREALRDVTGVEAAFLFGSGAAGTAQPDSDLDVLVVGDSVDARTLYRNLFEAGRVLRRQVNTLRYTRATLAERLAVGMEFPRNILEGPAHWLAGDPGVIAPIARAARVRFAASGAGTGA